MMLSFGGCCAAAGMIVQFPSALQRDKLRTPAIIWLAASAGSDLLIAAVLAALLARARRTVNNTHSMLIRASIETGFVSAAWTILILALYLYNSNSNVYNGLEGHRQANVRERRIGGLDH
ncbi:hypothetical protein RQP46_002559 [Phenoliferia psychrophenolica]